MQLRPRRLLHQPGPQIKPDDFRKYHSHSPKAKTPHDNAAQNATLYWTILSGRIEQQSTTFTVVRAEHARYTVIFGALEIAATPRIDTSPDPGSRH